MHQRYFSRNNFDLVRLIAAAQVAIVHGAESFHLELPRALAFVHYFPGVPVFFFISGFLISASWEKYEDVRNFATNRVLRIFPALWVVFFVSLAIVLLFDAKLDALHRLPALLVWAVTQLTILQDYNPPFLRDFGLGVINGSLWTIPIELFFYAATPVLYWIGKKLKQVDAVLVVVVIASFALQYWATMQGDLGYVQKVILTTPLPWIGMFCVGILGQRHFDRIYPYVADRFWPILGCYVLVSVLTAYVPLYPILRGHTNSVGLVNYPVLVALVLAMAYSGRGLADQLLRRNDISYGLYIYHMPVINLLVATSIGSAAGCALAALGTVVLAGLSWVLVEKPALSLREHALYRRRPSVPEADPAKD